MSQHDTAVRRKAISSGPPLIFAADAPTTLPEMLCRAAERAPRRGLVFVDDDGGEQFVAYAELVERARRCAASLHRLGLQAGDPVILTPRNTSSFVAAFWGAVLAGMIPALLPNPFAGRTAALDASSDAATMEVARLIGVWHQLGRTAMVVPDATLAFRALLERQAGTPLTLVTPESLMNALPDSSWPQADAGDTALLLYSSGSTSAPKGIIISHRNVMADVEATSRHNALGENDPTLCWAPTYHVIGLLCFHLLPVYTTANQVFLEPYSFLKRPELWLEKVHRHRVAFTGGPNFAFALAQVRVSQSRLAEWDLSCVKVLLNGGEVVSVAVLQEFYEHFRTTGLRREALAPAYGMSEATAGIAYARPTEPLRSFRIDRHRLAATGRAEPADESSNQVVEFANLGYVLPGFSLRIVDDQDRLLDERQVGHIQIRGQAVTSGYWSDQAATQRAFCDGWLRTGDLGFLGDGQLAVVGRSNDVIIVRGHNHHAHDLEQVIQSVPGVVPGRAVVTCAHDPTLGRELVLVFVAIQPPDNRETLRLILAALSSRAGVAVDRVVPLEADDFPRTATGKIQRRRLRELFESGAFVGRIVQPSDLGIGSIMPADKQPRGPGDSLIELQIEDFLGQRLAELLSTAPENLDVHTSVMELGVSSIEAVELVRHLEDRLGEPIEATLLFEYPTIAALARFLTRRFSADVLQRLVNSA